MQVCCDAAADKIKWLLNHGDLIAETLKLACRTWMHTTEAYEKLSVAIIISRSHLYLYTHTFSTLTHTPRVYIDYVLNNTLLGRTYLLTNIYIHFEVYVLVGSTSYTVCMARSQQSSYEKKQLS